jgi:hypothetical protein
MSGPSAIEKPISAKISVISSVTWLTGMDAAPRRAGPSRTGSVTSARSTAELLAERSLGKLAALGLERLANTLLQAVDDLAVSLALLRRKRAERLHQLRDASLSPERGDAHLFELVEVVSLGDGVKQLGLETVEL